MAVWKNFHTAFLLKKLLQNDTKTSTLSVKIRIKNYHFDTYYIICYFLGESTTFFDKSIY